MKLAKGNCGRKHSYKTRGDALVAVATQMRYGYKGDDWSCFRVYHCDRCKQYHLTKVRERR